MCEGPIMDAPYVGVEQVHAVQALAAVNAAFDATQGRFTLAHGQREGGGGRHRHSTTASTCGPVWTPGITWRGCISILGRHPATRHTEKQRRETVPAHKCIAVYCLSHTVLNVNVVGIKMKAVYVWFSTPECAWCGTAGVLGPHPSKTTCFAVIMYYQKNNPYCWQAGQRVCGKA